MQYVDNRIAEQEKKRKRDGSVEVYGAENVQGKKIKNGKCYLYVCWVTDDKEIFTWEPINKFENGCDLLDMLEEYDRFENKNFRRDYTEFLIQNYRGKNNAIIRPRQVDPIEVYMSRPETRNHSKRNSKKRISNQKGNLDNEEVSIDPEDVLDEPQLVTESVFPSADFLNRLMRPKSQRRLHSMVKQIEKKYLKNRQINPIVTKKSAQINIVSGPDQPVEVFGEESISQDKQSVSPSFSKETNPKSKKNRSGSKRKKAKNKRRGGCKASGEGQVTGNPKGGAERVELDSPPGSGSKKRFYKNRQNVYLTPVKKEEHLKAISSQKKTFYNSNLESYKKSQPGQTRKEMGRSMREFSVLSNKSSSLLRDSLVIKDDPNLDASEQENQIQLIQDRALIGKRRNTKNRTFTSDHKKDRRRRKRIKRTHSGRKTNFFVGLNDRAPYEYKKNPNLLFKRKSRAKQKPELVMKNSNKYLFNVESLSETPNDEEIKKFSNIFTKCRLK